MNVPISSVITGTGSYISSRKIPNDYFLNHEFYDSKGDRLKNSGEDIISKFLEITTIRERRYVTHDVLTSDMAFYAALEAIESAAIDKESLDYIIVAHNFGDIYSEGGRIDTVPTIASRVKKKLEISAPNCVAYDIIFGCPGWLQGMIQANYFIKSGEAKKILVIGAETLSRVCDFHDRDSMLYSDGAGAVILESKASDLPTGILSHSTRSDALEYSGFLEMGKSYNPNCENKDALFLKMQGRKLYQYALEKVPVAIKDCLEKSKIHISEIKKFLIHQANGKMDDAILHRLYGLYKTAVPDNIMPMTIGWLGNSSVATLPTLFDLLINEKLEDHRLSEGDVVVFASVGAGMNINAMIYKV